MTEEVEATDESRLTPMNVRSNDGAVWGVCRGRAAGSRWDNVVSVPVTSAIKCHRFGGNNTTERLIFNRRGGALKHLLGGNSLVIATLLHAG